jgi:hypothetical protein
MNYDEIEETFLRNLTFKVNRSSAGRSFSITPVFDSESIKAELEDDTE